MVGGVSVSPLRIKICIVDPSAGSGGSSSPSGRGDSCSLWPSSAWSMYIVIPLMVVTMLLLWVL
eukprot:4217923-Prorocentrum_lima.AAC.1